MKKTLLASVIALSIGSTASVANHSITITQMKFNDAAYAASGTLNANGGGQMKSIDNFFGNAWQADQQAWFDSDGYGIGTTFTWSGTGTSADNGNAISDFSYTFQLESNQVAVGTFFDWASSNNIPVLTIFDCPELGGGVCKGKSLPMTTNPFPGANTEFNGSTTCDFPMPNRTADGQVTPHECEPVVPIPATANFCDYYYDGKDGDTWTYVNQSFTESIYTYENINTGLNAGRIKVGNVIEGIIYDISGDVLTWYELVEEGPLIPPVNIPCIVTLNQETDMEYIMLKSPSFIVQSVVYNDAIMLVWLDKNYPASTMNTVLGLNGITASSVTDVEWYAKDVGLIKLLGVDAETGNNDGSIKELVSHKVKDDGLGGENGGGGGVLNIYLWFSLLPLLIFVRIKRKA